MTTGPENASKRFTDADLRGARFTRSDLSSVVMRGVVAQGMDIDSPWLLEGEGHLFVNGVDVAAYVDAELNRRFPGRAEQRAESPDGLRAAWAKVENAWAVILQRVASMPLGTVDIHVDGEWSFAQTFRHLIMATDTWLRKAILEDERPHHRVGQPHTEYETDGYDMSMFADSPTYAEVLEVRADRVAMVRDFLATATVEGLTVPRRNPWAPQHCESTLSCLHTILHEE